MKATITQLNAPAVGNRAQVMLGLQVDGKSAGNMVLSLHTDGVADEVEVGGIARDALTAALEAMQPKSVKTAKSEADEATADAKKAKAEDAKKAKDEDEKK